MSPDAEKRTAERAKFRETFCASGKKAAAERRALRPAPKPEKPKRRLLNPEERKANKRAYRRRNTRAIHLRKNYGITVRDYDAMLAAQGGRCLVCGSTFPGKGRDKLVVDHVQGTRSVRGLLCASCNYGLGCFEDSPDLLRAAAAYVECHGLRLCRAV